MPATAHESTITTVAHLPLVRIRTIIIGLLPYPRAPQRVSSARPGNGKTGAGQQDDVQHPFPNSGKRLPRDAPIYGPTDAISNGRSRGYSRFANPPGTA